MVKKWNQFINESVMPGPGENDSVVVNISDEDIEMFSSEPALQKLISDQKVALLGNEVWYFGHDENTIKVLKQYIDNFTTNESYKEKMAKKIAKAKETLGRKSGKTPEKKGDPNSYRNKMIDKVEKAKERAKNEARNMSIEELLIQYEEELQEMEQYERDYDDLVGLSDEDFYSEGEKKGKLDMLRRVISDLQKNFL